jgi:hypothetical protein
MVVNSTNTRYHPLKDHKMRERQVFSEYGNDFWLGKPSQSGRIPFVAPSITRLYYYHEQIDLVI